MSNIKFRVIKKETKDHWLAIEASDGCAELVDGKEIPIYNIRVDCSWDGCIRYSDFANGYGWDHECKDDCQCCAQNLHICDIDSFIETLQEIKKEFTKKFGEVE